MFVMSMLDRLTDVKKSTYAKIIAVLVSVAMVLSLTNMSAFAEGDGLSGIFGGNSDVVKVAVDLDNAKIEYGDQTVTNADKTFVASAGKDLKFKASAVTEDFTLDEVALVTTAENGSEVVTGLEGIDGTYTIKADDVADGITIKASATGMAPAENQSIQETAAQAEQAPAKAARGNNKGEANVESDHTPSAFDPNSLSELSIEQIIKMPANTTDYDFEFELQNKPDHTFTIVQATSADTVMIAGKKDGNYGYVASGTNGKQCKAKTGNSGFALVKHTWNEGKQTSYILIVVGNISYTVNYLEQGTNTVLREAKTVNNKTFGDKVTEQAIDIDGYNKVDPTEKTITIGAENNVINFYYTKRTDLSYEVHYFYEDATGTAVEDESSKVVSKTGAFGEKIPYDTNKTTYNEKHYVLDRVDGADKTIGTDSTQNVVNVYYTIDEVTDPNNDGNGEESGDGIPDKYQATVTYKVEGGNWNDNTVTDKTAVFTLKTKDAEGVWQDVTPVVTLGTTIPTPETKIGYTGAWDQAITNDTAVTGNATYTYKFTVNSYDYTVKYYTESIDSNNEIQAQEGWATGDKAEFGTTAAITPNASATINEKHYVLDSTNHSVVISENADNNVINVIYTIDEVTDPNNDGNGEESGDGIPDKYQATVDFTTADETQGTVGGDTTKVFTLRDAAGNPVESADVNVTADGVTTTASEGYAFFNWTGAEFGTQTLKGNDLVTFVANWAEDAVGTDPANPDQGDGIPDMYQALVQYVAVNGSVNIDHTYVTLLDENGQPSENGTGYLTAEQIAVATAAEGYDQDSLAWDVVPTTENAITGEVTYTVTFTANQPVVPAGPDTPGTTTPTPAPAGPVPGAAPAALAPVAAALAAPVAALIGDEPTPLAEEAIGDEEDPLAAFDHVNCWVHYYMILGILLTLVYGGCVIARRSNYSRKIQKMDDYATGKAMDAVEETENVANAAAQKMEA